MPIWKKLVTIGGQIFDLDFNHSTLTEGNEIKIQMGSEIKRRKLILSDFPQSISKEMKRIDFSLFGLLSIL